MKVAVDGMQNARMLAQIFLSKISETRLITMRSKPDYVEADLL